MQTISDKQKEVEAIGLRIDQYQKEIEETKKSLKQPKMSESDKQTLLIGLKAKMDSLGELQDRQAAADKTIKDLQEQSKSTDFKAVAKQRTQMEKKIVQCDILAANLLKGKSIEDIEVKVENGRFTEPTGKLKQKIEASKEEPTKENTTEAEQEQVQEQETSLVEQTEFEKKHPRLAKISRFFKNIKEKLTNRKGKEEEPEKEPDTAEAIAKTIGADEAAELESEFLSYIKETRTYKDAEQKRQENRQAAADRYAKQYGGRYNTQDGASNDER